MNKPDAGSEKTGGVSKDKYSQRRGLKKGDGPVFSFSTYVVRERDTERNATGADRTM